MTFDEFCTHRPPTRQRVPFEQLLTAYGEVFAVTNASASAVNQANRSQRRKTRKEQGSNQ